MITFQLTSLQSEHFDDLVSLESLNLNNNSLSHLDPGVFQALSKLSFLSLVHSKLYSLQSELFQGLTSLNQLNLQANGLAQLESGTFTGLSSLTILNIGMI